MPVVVPGSSRVEHVMGMPIIVDVRDELVADERDRRGLRLVPLGRRDVQHVQARQRDLPARPRRARARRRAPGCSGACSPAATSCCEETGGYFDVRAGASRRLDPSGLVKGWAVDRAAAILDDAGATNYAVNAGGDIRVRGGALPGARRGASGSSIRSSATASPPSSRPATSRSRPRAPTSAASTSSTRTPACHRPACSPSRSPAPTSRPPTPTRRPRSRWGRAPRNGRRHSRATRR